MTNEHALTNENGDAMKKPTKKFQTVLFGSLLVLVIISMNSGILGIGGDRGQIEETSKEYADLEEALMEYRRSGRGQIISTFQ